MRSSQFMCPPNPASSFPLSAFAHYEPTNTAALRQPPGHLPAITLSFNLASRRFSRPAVDHIEQARRELGVPSTVHATFQGTAQAFQDRSPISNLILTALAAVYIVLGHPLRKLHSPHQILSTIPSAGIARSRDPAHQVRSDIIALIGIILLIASSRKTPFS